MVNVTRTKLQRIFNDDVHDPALVSGVTVRAGHVMSVGAYNKFKDDHVLVNTGRGVSDPNPVRFAGGGVARRRVNISKHNLDHFSYKAGGVGCHHARVDLPKRENIQ